MSGTELSEKEWQTRKRRIDPKLDARGWLLPPTGTTPLKAPYRSEEEPTDNGPADYALWSDNKCVGIVEAKKVAVGPQGRLSQAERYARGLRNSPYNFQGLHCPFLYATNGEIIWYHDVRHPLNLSRRITTFHMPSALQELLSRDFNAAESPLSTEDVG
jgi:type I restriction enzyme R subunit